MKSYEIQVDLHHDGQWHTSKLSTSRGWQKDLDNHKAAYPSDPARAVKIRTVKILRVLKVAK